MTAERLFPILNLLAIAGWLPLLFVPRARWATTTVPAAVAVLLAVAYVALIAASVPGGAGGFASLADVRLLFADDLALLAGWAHYLDFDLLVGAWEVRDARRRGIRHVLVVPALALTFLLGPAGLLVYLAVRAVASRRDGVARERAA